MSSLTFYRGIAQGSSLPTQKAENTTVVGGPLERDVLRFIIVNFTHNAALPLRRAFLKTGALRHSRPGFA